MHWDELCSQENFPDRKEKAEGSFHFLLQTLSELADEPLEEEEVVEIGMLAWASVHGLANLWAEGVLQAKGRTVRRRTDVAPAGRAQHRADRGSTELRVLTTPAPAPAHSTRSRPK